MSQLDLDLKLAMERTLWAAGYYTRSNVKLASATRGSTKRGRASADLTDVDVLGIRVLDDLEPRKVAVDCKSGAAVSPVGRTFWLKGVMEHVGADRGYVVLARSIPDHQRSAAANLGITLVDRAALSGLQARYPTLPDSLRVGDIESHRYLEDNIIKLPAHFDSLLEFRDTAFWYYGDSRAISQAIQRTAKVRDKADLRQKFQRALLLDVAGLFSLSILSLAFDVAKLAASDTLDSVRSLFFGGPEGIARREQILRTVKSLISHVAQQARLPFDDVGEFQLDPPFLPAVAEAVARVIARPIEASEAPRYLKLRLMHTVLYGEADLPAVVGSSYSPIADKLAGDLALAYLKSSGFDLAAAKELGAVD